MWKTCDPDISEVVTPKRVRTPGPKESGAICFLVNRKQTWTTIILTILLHDSTLQQPIFFTRIDIVVFRCRYNYAELGTANLRSVPQPRIPQNCKRCSATANPQVCDRFAVTFRASATANAHCTSANLDHNIYCYFVLVMTFLFLEVKFCRRPDVDPQQKNGHQHPDVNLQPRK